MTSSGYPRWSSMTISRLQWLGSKIRTKPSILRSVLFTLNFLGSSFGSSSQSFAERIASFVYRCYNAVNLSPIFTSRTAFNSTHKDKLPIFKQSMLIYRFVCRCSWTYTGRSCQRLEMRIRQHVPRVILSKGRQTSGHFQTMDSAIGEHLLTINSYRTSYEDDCFSILLRVRDKIQLKVLDAIHIAINRLPLCRQSYFEYFGGTVGDWGDLIFFSHLVSLILLINSNPVFFGFFSRWLAWQVPEERALAILVF